MLIRYLHWNRFPAITRLQTVRAGGGDVARARSGVDQCAARSLLAGLHSRPEVRRRWVGGEQDVVVLQPVQQRVERGEERGVRVQVHDHVGAPGAGLVDEGPLHRRADLDHVVLEEPAREVGDAEVAGLLAVVAGQDAQAARVDRQRLVQAELGREVGDRPGQIREPLLPPRVLRAAGRIERAGPRATKPGVLARLWMQLAERIDPTLVGEPRIELGACLRVRRRNS